MSDEDKDDAAIHVSLYVGSRRILQTDGHMIDGE